MRKRIIETETTLQTLSIDLERLGELPFDWDNRWLQMKRGNVQVRMKFFNTPHIQFSWAYYSDAVLIQGTPPPETMTLSLIRSRKRVMFHNREIGPGEFVTLLGGEEADYFAGGENFIFTLTVGKEFFHRSFLHYFGFPYDESGGGEQLLLLEGSAERFMAQVHRQIDSLLRVGDRSDGLRYYLAAENEIMGQLFSMLRMSEIGAGKERFDLTRAREVLHENVENIYGIGDLLDELKISARTLQHHFRQKFGITPKQYLQRLRLNAVNMELLRADPGSVRISEVALKYGFFHASHFGSEYKKMFGESPSETLRRTL